MLVVCHSLTSTNISRKCPWWPQGDQQVNRLVNRLLKIDYSTLSAKRNTLFNSSSICNGWITYITLMGEPWWADSPTQMFHLNGRVAVYYLISVWEMRYSVLFLVVSAISMLSKSAYCTYVFLPSVGSRNIFQRSTLRSHTYSSTTFTQSLIPPQLRPYIDAMRQSICLVVLSITLIYMVLDIHCTLMVLTGYS
jgi:hypothetical protein